MTWVTGKYAYGAGRANPDFEKYHSVNRHLAGYTGIPMTVMMSGISKYGKYHYKPDGFIYITRRKRPIGRYLRVERCGGIEVALRPGRLQDVAELEALRWRLLLRVINVLGPELEHRARKVRRHGRSFRGYYNKQLYQITCRPTAQGIEFNEVDNDRKELGPLDHMAADWTSKEDDQIADYFISMADRVAKAWVAVGTASICLLRAINDLAVSKLGQEPEYGGYADVLINGRHYIVWVGRGGRLKTSEDCTELWPRPDRMSLTIEPSSAKKETARYGTPEAVMVGGEEMSRGQSAVPEE